MGEQGDIFIGVLADDEEAAIAIFKKLGVDDIYEAEIPITLTCRGKAFDTDISFHTDGEDGFPGVVGVRLTKRYSPAILDYGVPGCEHGKSTFFYLDLLEIQNLLHQVQKVMPEAQPILMDVWY